MTTATETAAPPRAATAPTAEPTGLHRVVTTTDHKVVGRLYVVFSLVGVLGALVLAVLSQVEHIDPTKLDLFGNDTTVTQLFTLARAGLIFVGVVPLFVGLALSVVPLQVGSPTVAFPRAAAASFWGWLLGAGIFVAGYVGDGGIGGAAAGTRGRSVALSLLGLGLMVVSLCLAAVCIATTVVALRTTGMSLRRVPAFSWSMLVASSVWLLTLPVLLANIAIAYVDFRNGRTGYGIPEAIPNSLGWAWRQPQALAYALPAAGVVAEIVPVFARTRQKLYGVLLVAIAVLGFVSFGAFDQPAAKVEDRFVYILFGFVAVVPVLLLVGVLADSVRRGKPTGVPAAHVGLGLAALLGLLLTVVIGGLRVLAPNDLELLGSSATDAYVDAALLTAVAGGLAGLLYWRVKIVGRDAAEGLPRLAGLALFAGIFLTAIAELVGGLLDQPAGPFADAVKDSVKGFNVVALVGVALALLGVAGVVLSIVTRLQASPGASRDPWGGHTLEWDTISPPPAGNFAEAVPLVRSERPLLDRAEEVA